jgi:hypothetical protein
MLQPAARCRAAGPLAASDPIQASEAKAPLAESRGACAALWTRIGFDVSEAVPFDCQSPSNPSTGRARATGSEDSIDVRVASFGSEQSRPTSALGLGLGFGLPRPPGWAAYTGQTWAHCHPSDAAGRWGTEIRRA